MRLRKRRPTSGNAVEEVATFIPSPTLFVGEGASLSERVRARCGIRGVA
jgi:hypothetical protein